MRIRRHTVRKDPNYRAIITAVPIVLCNTVAITAQYQFFHAALKHWDTLGAVLFAVSLESISVFLAYFAHQALVSNDAALRLRLGSYGMGILIGMINFSHYAPGWHVNAEALSVGLLSAWSPVGWGIYSRRVSRDVLMQRGAVEAHSVRLGSVRWTFHPVKSLRVFSATVWDNPRATPVEAIAAYENRRSAVQGRESRPVVPAVPASQLPADPDATVTFTALNADGRPKSESHR